MRVSVQIEGQREVMRSLARLGAGAEPAAKRAIDRVTERIVPKARAITPVEPEDGGQLRDSVRQEKAERDRSGEISGAVVAGGEPLEPYLEGRRANVYAIEQHEDPSLHHTTGEWKFVEKPFLQEAPRALGELRDEIDREAARAL